MSGAWGPPHKLSSPWAYRVSMAWMPTYTALKLYFSNMICSIFSRLMEGFMGGSVNTMRMSLGFTFNFLELQGDVAG